MSRFIRLLVPLAAFAACIVLAMTITPRSVAGEPPVAAGTAKDVTVFGRETTIDRRVDGSVQVYGANAIINGEVTGDLLVFGGNIRFGANGRVFRDVIAVGGRVDEAQGKIGGRLYSTRTAGGAISILSNAAAESRGLFAVAALAMKASLLVLWFAVAVAGALSLGREIRFSSVEVRGSALYCFALGLVALTSFLLSAILFGYLIPFGIGLPLLTALAVIAVATKIYGMLVVFHAVGTIIAGSRTSQQLASRRWLRGDLAMVVIGLLILGAVRMIPVVGSVVWALASVFGVGVTLATKFGRREPWFLALNPA